MLIKSIRYKNFLLHNCDWKIIFTTYVSLLFHIGRNLSEFTDKPNASQPFTQLQSQHTL